MTLHTPSLLQDHLLLSATNSETRKEEARFYIDCAVSNRLFRHSPYFSAVSQMSIVEFDGPPSWSLDASETGESTKYPLVVGGGGGGNGGRKTKNIGRQLHLIK